MDTLKTVSFLKLKVERINGIHLKFKNVRMRKNVQSYQSNHADRVTVLIQ